MRRSFRSMFRILSLLRRPGTLFQALYRDKRAPLVSKVLPLVALAYLLFPIDLVPDFLVGLGILDDVTIVSLLLAAAIRRLPPELRDELEKRNRPASTNTQGNATMQSTPTERQM